MPEAIRKSSGLTHSSQPRAHNMPARYPDTPETFNVERWVLGQSMAFHRNWILGFTADKEGVILLLSAILIAIPLHCFLLTPSTPQGDF